MKIMRRIIRTELDGKTRSFLEKRQERVNSGELVQKAWETARPTKALKRVFNALTEMAGKRSRCFYCEDSRGAEIEHFWPKSVYAARVFDWLNLLLVCSGCNRLKGAQFPLDALDKPLLIDPTSDNPWDHLFFEPKTGMLVARWDAETDSPDPKGLATTDPALLPLNIESITEGRRRVVRRLMRAVGGYLSESAYPGRRTEALRILKEAISDNDDYGLTPWFFRQNGQGSEPFRSLRKKDPDAWTEILRLVA